MAAPMKTTKPAREAPAEGKKPVIIPVSEALVDHYTRLYSEASRVPNSVAVPVSLLSYYTVSDRHFAALSGIVRGAASVERDVRNAISILDGPVTPALEKGVGTQTVRELDRLISVIERTTLAIDTPPAIPQDRLGPVVFAAYSSLRTARPSLVTTQQELSGLIREHLIGDLPLREFLAELHSSLTAGTVRELRQNMVLLGQAADAARQDAP